MPAKKKPTMLQRQRALRKQQQQTKQQSQRQLPPGRKGGSVDKPKGSKPNPPRSNQPVEQVRVRDLGSTKPKPMSGGTPRALPPGNPGGQLARVARTATSTAAKVGAAGRALPIVGSLLTAAGEIRAMADRQQRWDAYKERMGMNKPTPSFKPSSTSGGRRTGTNNRTANLSLPTSSGGTRAGAAAGTRTRSSAPTKPPLSSTGVRTPNGNAVATGSPEYNRYRQAQLDANRERNTQVRDTTPSRQTSTQSGGGSTQSRSSGGGSSRPSTSRQSSPSSTPKPRFTGSAEEGRQMWAEKYSSSKYDGQAIQKEAKKLLEKLKKQRETQSGATRAGWDGNKNY